MKTSVGLEKSEFHSSELELGPNSKDFSDDQRSKEELKMLSQLVSKKNEEKKPFIGGASRSTS